MIKQMGDVVLVLSYGKDITAQRVVDALRAAGAHVVFCDTGSFPASIRLDATFVRTQWQGAFWYEGTWYDLAQIKSVLVRRPTHYHVDSEAPELIQAFLENEALKGFGGILRSFKQTLWMNDLDAQRAANFKPVQLQTASQVGFSVPRSLITNDPDAVRRFAAECRGRLIYKTLHGGNIAGGGKVSHAIFTSLVTPESLEHLERVKLTAHYFQVYIEKWVELRITVIGNHVLAVAIDSQRGEATRVDWRASYADLKYRPYTLPTVVEEQCIALTRALGLSYGAIDMIVTPESEYQFLEINPGGQYEWLEHETHLPFSETIANVLMQGKKGLYGR
jgi:glutathione synthase/RimK-type ligase-like ATP-grasp enzyme